MPFRDVPYTCRVPGLPLGSHSLLAFRRLTCATCVHAKQLVRMPNMIVDGWTYDVDDMWHTVAAVPNGLTDA